MIHDKNENCDKTRRRTREFTQWQCRHFNVREAGPLCYSIFTKPPPIFCKQFYNILQFGFQNLQIISLTVRNYLKLMEPFHVVRFSPNIQRLGEK